MQADRELSFTREIFEETLLQGFRGASDWAGAGAYMFGTIFFLIHTSDRADSLAGIRAESPFPAVQYPALPDLSDKQIGLIGIAISGAVGAAIGGTRGAIKVVVKHLNQNRRP